MDSPRVIVVGGDVAGMAAARLLALRGASVRLLETGRSLGGSWNAFEAEVGGESIGFDRGVRLAMGTGSALLDESIYESLPGFQWNKIHGFPNEGHVFRGHLHETSPCVDARRLGVARCAKGRAQLAAADQGEGANLAEWLDRHYGAVFADEIFRPFMRKMLGEELEALAPAASTLFVPRRLILADQRESEAMRRDARFADRIAVPDARQLAPEGRVYYYPRRGSMGAWVDASARDLRRLGVHVHTETSVSEVMRDGTTVTGVLLGSGVRVACDALVWALPAPQFLRAAGLAMPSVRTSSRGLAMVHVVLDQEPSTDLAFATFYDPDHLSYRASFYRALRPNASARERRAMSVEVVLDSDRVADEIMVRRTVEELIETGLVPASSLVEFARVERFPRLFSVPTPALAAGIAQCVRGVSDSANAHLVGRTDEDPFLPGILRGCERVSDDVFVAAERRAA